MILVLDSSALITLARIGELNLLRHFAETISIPTAVYDEVVRAGHGRPGSEELAHAEWIIRREVSNQEAVDRLRGQLGPGEAEAIVLAREIRADLLILDDAVARRLAEEQNLTVVGLLGLIMEARRRGKIGALKPILDRMMEAGFYLDDRLYEALLSQAGEKH